MNITRIIKSDIINKIKRFNKAIIIYGARQIGKTTLCEDVLKKLNLKTLYINADEGRFISQLSSKDSRQLLDLVQGYEIVLIDEAQRIPDIGINLKIILDNAKKLKVIATGSSSFELANKISEPLTGRKWTFKLYPISQLELTKDFNTHELYENLEERLIWGSYPEIFSLKGGAIKIDYLREITADYLYKDVFALNEIKNSDKVRQLLKLLAFQIGQEASLSELANTLGISKETVEKYIDLFEKTFVIFKLSGFSRNLRKEVTKMHKYYFYDLGIRNTLIDDFKPLSERNDIGSLFENFIIMERVKRNAYKKIAFTPYFWRTYTGAEIDYVEESEGILKTCEIKYKKSNAKMPKTFKENYPNSTFQIINKDNFLDFVI